MTTEGKYGARVYYYDDGVILVKQTVKRGSTYVIDVGPDGLQREAHVNKGDDERLTSVIRLAGEGGLTR